MSDLILIAHYLSRSSLGCPFLGTERKREIERAEERETKKDTERKRTRQRQERTKERENANERGNGCSLGSCIGVDHALARRSNARGELIEGENAFWWTMWSSDPKQFVSFHSILDSSGFGGMRKEKGRLCSVIQ